MSDNDLGAARRSSWARLAEGRGAVFAWVERPDGVRFYANFDDGYLYAEGDNYRYGPETLRMSRVDATGWRIVGAPR